MMSLWIVTQKVIKPANLHFAFEAALGGRCRHGRANYSCSAPQHLSGEKNNAMASQFECPPADGELPAGIRNEEHCAPLPPPMPQSMQRINDPRASKSILRGNPQANYAIFIDGQNVPAKHFPLIQQHLQDSFPSQCLPSIKRFYGGSQEWAEFILQHGLHRPYCYPGVNIDTLMSVDVMEALYKHPHVRTYVLVTGDGDFAPLVHKLREAGKIVVGYGLEKSSAPALTIACHCYFNMEQLGAEVARKQSDLANELLKKEGERADDLAAAGFTREVNKGWEKMKNVIAKNAMQIARNLFGGLLAANDAFAGRPEERKQILKHIENAMDGSQKDEWVNISALGNVVPFKKYGYEKLSDLIRDLDEIDMKYMKSTYWMRRTGYRKEVRRHIEHALAKVPKGEWVDISVVGAVVPYEKYGFKKLSELIQDFDEYEVKSVNTSCRMRKVKT